MNKIVEDIIRELEALADSDKALLLGRYFKTGKGGYGEGDRFYGITVPVIRKLAAKHSRDLDLSGIRVLLTGDFHEQRLLALHCLVERYRKADESEKAGIVKLYLAHSQWINNWDLVDTSAPKIIGDFLREGDRGVLWDLVASQDLWEKRIGVLATFAFIRDGDFGDALKVARLMIAEPHDLLQKASGWMLREIGKRDVSALRGFLDAHHTKMPRTMLRYAIEKLSADERKKYLKR